MQAQCTIRRILLFAKIKHWHPNAEHKENQENQLHFSLLNVSISIFLILAIALNNLANVFTFWSSENGCSIKKCIAYAQKPYAYFKQTWLLTLRNKAKVKWFIAADQFPVKEIVLNLF